MTGTAEWIGECAYNALIEEVNTTPKPGLVDLYSNGAHTDMDAETFRRSAEALRPFFVQMAREGLSFDGSAEELFMGLRSVGMDAEQAMYAATGGVNTHKGAIFTFGIFCAGAGRCLKEQRELTALGLLEMEQEMTVRVLTAELEKLRGKISAAGQATHGERNLHRYGTAGCRGEAIEGYPGVFGIALPVLRAGLSSGRDWNRVKLQALLTLMAHTEDSNILSRHNPAVLRDVQEEMLELLRCGGAYREDAIKLLEDMDADYSRRGISAGGCAGPSCGGDFYTGVDGGRGSVKRLTAILLVIALTISACSAPAGAGGSSSGETGSVIEQTGSTSEEADSQVGESAEDLTEAEWTAEDRTDREEGFVPAEETQESAGEQLVEEQSAEEQPAEEQPASEEDTPSGSLETPESSESAEEQESKPGLVILEEDNDDYRGAAGLKASDIDEKTSQLHAVTNGSGGSKTGGKTAAKAVKDYTVMVYIVGSNLESRLGAATTDIGEMKQAGIDQSPCLHGRQPPLGERYPQQI